MSAKRSNPEFINGVPELLILKLVSRRPMHGYELVRAIRQGTGDALAFGEGCIYPVLHRLESEGLLSSRREPVSGRSRVVYRLTPPGRKRLAAAAANWVRITAAVQSILQGGNYATTSFA